MALVQAVHLNAPPSAVPASPAQGSAYNANNSTPGRSHASGRSGDRQHMCEWPNCGKTFGQHAHLVTHVKLVHEGSRDFVCTWENCGRSFGLKSNLQTHIRTVHEGRKDYTCQWENCGRSFGDQGNLAKHVRTVHEGRKDYVCPMPECGRSFSQKGHLGIHIRTVHEGRKDYVCHFENCGRSFGYQSDLTSHIRTVHEGRKDFVCNWDDCGRSFSQKGHLTTHIRTVHEGRKDYVCVIEGCGRSFGHHFQLTRHLRTMHESHPLASAKPDESGEAQDGQISSHFNNTKKRSVPTQQVASSPNKKLKTDSAGSILPTEELPGSLGSVSATRVKGGVRLVRGRSPKAQEILAANSHNSSRRTTQPKRPIHRQPDTLLANEELPPEDDDLKPPSTMGNTPKNAMRTVLRAPGEIASADEAAEGEDVYSSPKAARRLALRTPPSTKTAKGRKPRTKRKTQQDDHIANLLMGMKSSRVVTEPNMEDDTESEADEPRGRSGRSTEKGSPSPSRKGNARKSLKVKDSPAKSTHSRASAAPVASPTRASRTRLAAVPETGSPMSTRGSRSSNKNAGAASRQSSEGLMLLLDATVQDNNKKASASAARSPGKQSPRMSPRMSKK